MTTCNTVCKCDTHHGDEIRPDHIQKAGKLNCYLQFQFQGASYNFCGTCPLFIQASHSWHAAATAVYGRDGQFMKRMFFPPVRRWMDSLSTSILSPQIRESLRLFSSVRLLNTRAQPFQGKHPAAVT